LILGVPAPAAASAIPLLPEPLFLFDGLSSAALDRLLVSLEQTGIPRSTLKAVLTPVNAKWNLPRLWAELCQERLTFL